MIADSTSTRLPVRRRSADEENPPRPRKLLLRLFTCYARRYIARRFHALRISKEASPSFQNDRRPIVAFTNHASWWDPLVGLVIKEELFPDRTLHTPIDADMLKRYSFFKHLGFFGIEKNSRFGAAHFLRQAISILSMEGSLLAITAQGRFADVRERPLRLLPGLGHLAAQSPNAIFLPVALEYVFWEESCPEALVQFGLPIEVKANAPARSHREWTALFEESLEKTQNSLAALSCQRNPEMFLRLAEGASGQGGVYDVWQFFKAFLTGKTYRRQHGEL